MKHKAHIHNKRPRIYITRNPTFPTQKNQRNFSTATSRVQASPNRSHGRCQVPDAQEGKSADCTIIQWPRPPDRCCRHNSLILLLPSQQLRRYPQWNGHDTAGRSHRVPPALSRITAVSRTTERLSHETRRRSHRQHHASTNGCLHVLHTSFTREEDVRSYWQHQLDCPLARPRAADCTAA